MHIYAKSKWQKLSKQGGDTYNVYQFFINDFTYFCITHVKIIMALNSLN